MGTRFLTCADLLRGVRTGKADLAPPLSEKWLLSIRIYANEQRDSRSKWIVFERCTANMQFWLWFCLRHMATGVMLHAAEEGLSGCVKILVSLLGYMN